MKRYLPFAIIAAVLVIAILAGALMYRTKQPPISTTPVPTPSLDPNQARTNNRTAVTLEEFGDYQCPPCGTLHPVLKTIKDEFGDRVQFSFRHFPLVQIHQHAVAASQAAVAAGLQGRFWEMHDLLYKNQSVWSSATDARPIFLSYARQLGLNVDLFVNDMGGNRANTIVASDLRRGQALGVNSTPTVFINGREIPFEELKIDNLRKEIRSLLNGG
ncbi:MAG: DsbA family protein [Acidobacteria bacterium]|nr:DsbA family protein [Acidobacteriota bacterium]